MCGPVATPHIPPHEDAVSSLHPGSLHGEVVLSDGSQPNGFLRWRDLDQHGRDSRAEWRTDLADSVARRDAQVGEIKRDIASLESRADKLEQWHDRWLGPAMAAIGTLQVASLAANIWVAFR